MFNEDRLSHSRSLLRKINALNVYQISLYKRLNFMHKFKNQETPRIFIDLIKNPAHTNPTNFLKSNFCSKNVSLNSTKYSVSFRGSKLCNEILDKEENELKFYSFFQNIIKSKLLIVEN